MEGRPVDYEIFELGEVQLHPPLPEDTFRLAAPAGYEARSQTLVPAEAAPSAR